MNKVANFIFAETIPRILSIMAAVAAIYGAAWLHNYFPTSQPALFVLCVIEFCWDVLAGALIIGAVIVGWTK